MSPRRQNHFTRRTANATQCAWRSWLRGTQMAAIEELAASRGVLLAEAAVADYLPYPWLPLRLPVTYLTPTLN